MMFFLQSFEAYQFPNAVELIITRKVLPPILILPIDLKNLNDFPNITRLTFRGPPIVALPQTLEHIETVQFLSQEKADSEEMMVNFIEGFVDLYSAPNLKHV